MAEQVPAGEQPRGALSEGDAFAALEFVLTMFGAICSAPQQ
jgi:hypothetical protein